MHVMACLGRPRACASGQYLDVSASERWSLEDSRIVGQAYCHPSSTRGRRLRTSGVDYRRRVDARLMAPPALHLRHHGYRRISYAPGYNGLGLMTADGAPKGTDRTS